MAVIFLLLATVLTVCAQPATTGAPASAGTPAKAVRQRMEESIRKQKSSVRQQVNGVHGSDSNWFTVPWSLDSLQEFIASPPGDPALAAPSGLASPSPASASAPAPATSTASPTAWCNPLPLADLAEPINAAAARENISPELIRAMIAKESAFTPCAVSNRGAIGLMQLMPLTAAAMGVMDPFNPEDNVNGGAKYLGQLLSRYGGNLRLALGAYNAGPGWVDQYKNVPPIPETQNYVRSILEALGSAVTGVAQ